MRFNIDLDGRDKAKEAIAKVIDSGWFIDGGQLEEFERAWARFNLAPFAVGVGSGTDALRIALLALGVGPGDEVITPAFNVAYTAQAVRAIGARSVFVDVNKDTWLMRPGLIADAVTPRTRAIIPVHLFGQMCDMPSISTIAQHYGLVVIEDAAQAHGAYYQHQFPGELSEAACYSHYPTKNLGCYGEGGSITTRLPIVAERAKLLRDAGRTDRYVHMLPGVNSMLDEMQAAVLNTKLPYLHLQNGARRVLADRYAAALAGVGDLRFQGYPGDAHHVYHLFVVTTERREGLMAHLRGKGIPTYSHYPVPMHRQPFILDEALEQGPFPVAEALARTVVSLPLYPSMTLDEQDIVIAAVREFYG